MQQSVCDWLEARKGVKVQQNWVDACLEWIEQEEGGGAPVARMREMVYEQWLHADLRDVVVQPCIPASVPEQQTTTITGNFIVQVDSLVDVGAAAYAQLQKTKGQSIDEIDTKKNFEPKPTRLLLLSLTDGVTDFQAMEYHPIPQLTTQLTPGAKLLLRGSIGCRLGTLLLSGEQVEVLGGGVETLAEVNSQTRVLARALNDESLAGDGVPPPITGSSTSAAGPPPPESEQLQQRENMAGGEGTGTGVEEIGDLDLENFEDFEDNMEEQLLEDGQGQWPDDVGFSPLETSLEDGGEEGGGEGGGEGGREFGDCEKEQVYTSAGPSGNTYSNYSSFQSRTAGQKRRYPSPFSGETPSDERTQGSIDLPGPSGLGMTGDKRSKVQRQTESYSNVWESTEENAMMDMKMGTSGNSSHWKEGRRGMVSGVSRGGAGAGLNDSTKRNTSVAAVRPLMSAIEGGRGELMGGRGGGSGGVTEDRGGVRGDRGGSGGVTEDRGGVRGDRGGGSEVGRGRVSGGGLSVTPEATSQLGGGSTPQDCGDTTTPGVPTVQSISEAVDVWTNGSLVRVKARFVRVTSKLTPADGCWTVAVVLEDSRGAELNVQLSNQVLEKLIGFSAQEFVEHIQPNKKDPAIRARGSQGFKHCQSYLASLNCVMEIRKPQMFGDDPTVERLLDTE